MIFFVNFTWCPVIIPLTLAKKLSGRFSNFSGEDKVKLYFLPNIFSLAVFHLTNQG